VQYGELAASGAGAGGVCGGAGAGGAGHLAEDHGDRVGLHPLAIIIAVMTGTTLLGGILGGILAIRWRRRCG